MPETADDIVLDQTCGACPEQYDAYIGGVQVGYLRLRHGTFRVDCPTSGGETVYRAYPDGDGCFMDHERARHLAAARQAILDWRKARSEPDAPAEPRF